MRSSSSVIGVRFVASDHQDKTVDNEAIAWQHGKASPFTLPLSEVGWPIRGARQNDRRCECIVSVGKFGHLYELVLEVTQSVAKYTVSISHSQTYAEEL